MQVVIPNKVSFSRPTEVNLLKIRCHCGLDPQSPEFQPQLTQIFEPYLKY